MCTCISKKIENKNYFGRTMDIDESFGERVVITPRNYPYRLKNGKALDIHFAIHGMATVELGYPLYADAMNEKGLSMAGLNFPISAHYEKNAGIKADNALAPYELIPFVLGSASDIPSAKRLLSSVKICDVPFSEKTGTSPLHWQIADRDGKCVVLECTREGLKIYDNRTGILTNEPPFPSQIAHLEHYRGLSSHSKNGEIKSKLMLSDSSLGNGALGLPGDATSLSRFVRAAFLSANLECEENEQDRLCGLFRILECVSIVKGAVKAKKKNHYTRYISLMDTAEGLYRYRFYNQFSVSCVSFSQAELESQHLIEYGV